MLRVAVWPGFKIVPLGIPLALNPGPEMLILLMVTAELVEFVKLTVAVLVSPNATLPRLIVDVFALNCAPESTAFPLAAAIPAQPDWYRGAKRAPITSSNLSVLRLEKNSSAPAKAGFMALRIESSQKRNHWPVEQSENRLLPGRQSS
jgi:hypothetical protein